MQPAPTIYFIDDSATMREVIKIAFRRENMNVVTCHDAGVALEEIARTKPDVVITDVIMPGKDGYDVCLSIKNDPELGKTPVILMSGVVNRAVAERAFAVKADELLRKPFQPQDLIARVKNLLNQGAPASAKPVPAVAAAALSSIFSGLAPAAPRPMAAVAPRPVSVAPAAVAAVAMQPAVTSQPAQTLAVTAAFPFIAPHPAAAAPAPTGAPAARPANSSDTTKLRVEILRLEGLVKKLQSELQAERDYCRALEEHIKTLQQGD
jgi:CheY-like chemotaxis protein